MNNPSFVECTYCNSTVHVLDTLLYSGPGPAGDVENAIVCGDCAAEHELPGWETLRSAFAGKTVDQWLR